MTAALTLDNITVSYSQKTVIEQLSLMLEPGEIGCLLGASGSGKSTILRAIAGFETLDSGEIRLQGNCVSDCSHSVAAHQRPVGMVFQELALFPHLTVWKNIAFGISRLSKSLQRQRVDELLCLVGLADRSDAYPHQLSGGQQQRVALARALAPKPQILLLDEPFSSLDSGLRKQLAEDVRTIVKATGTTALLVTHDQNEAFAMADKLGVLHQRRLHQWDRPQQLYHHPASIPVAELVSEGTSILATVESSTLLSTAIGSISSVCPIDHPIGQRVEMWLRPQQVRFQHDSPLCATVVSRVFRGQDCLYRLQVSNGQNILALLPHHLLFEPGDQIGIAIAPEPLILLSP